MIRVFFVDGFSTTPVRLQVGTTGKFGLKEQGKYDDGFIVSDISWTEVEDDGIYHYVFEPNFNTTQLNALLGIGAGDDKASVTLMGEIEWISSGSISSSATFSAVVQNDVIRGDEGVPTDGDPEYPNPELIVTYLHTITALTGGTATDLDGLVTATGDFDNRAVLVRISGAGRMYVLVAGTDAEAAPGIIRPDDYATTTNEKVWKQII